MKDLLAHLQGDASKTRQPEQTRKSWGPAALLPFDGFVRVRPLDVYIDVTKAAPKRKKFVIVLAVDDEHNGAVLEGTLYKHMVFEGNRRDGVPNAVQAINALLSGGMANSDLPPNFVPEEIARMLATRPSYIVEVRAQEYQGNVTSSVEDFIMPSRYAREVEAGTARNIRTSNSVLEPASEQIAEEPTEPVIVEDMLADIA